MAERPTRVLDGEILPSFVSGVSQIEGVCMIVKVNDDGNERAYVLVPEDYNTYSRISEVVIEWRRVLDTLDASLEELSQFGPVWCEGQFEEFIQSTGGENAPGRKMTILYQKPRKAVKAAKS